MRSRMMSVLASVETLARRELTRSMVMIGEFRWTQDHHVHTDWNV